MRTPDKAISIEEPYISNAFKEPGCPDVERKIVASLAYHILTTTDICMEKTIYGLAMLKEPYGLSIFLVLTSELNVNPGVILTRNHHPMRYIYPRMLYATDESTEMNELLEQIGESRFDNGDEQILTIMLSLLDRLSVRYDNTFADNVRRYWAS